jgi:DNA-binding CsgD family transcriptional regulator
MVHVELFRGFFDTHLGYQIKEIVCQPLDSPQILASFEAGLFWFSEEGIYVDGRSLRTGKLSDGPFLMGGDRETASRAFGSWFSGLLLSHTPARLYFRPTEQRLLAAALRGLTDEELAAELGVSLAAVKKTWRMIYERTLSILRHDAPDNVESAVFGKRGKEKKQHLLTYLREHMEELRPALPPRTPGHAHQEHVRS